MGLISCPSIGTTLIYFVLQGSEPISRRGNDEALKSIGRNCLSASTSSPPVRGSRFGSSRAGAHSAWSYCRTRSKTFAGASGAARPQTLEDAGEHRCLVLCVAPSNVIYENEGR